MKTRLAEKMAYRGDFFISISTILIGDLMLPFITYLIYRSGAAFPGWTLEEVLFIQAVFLLAQGIAFPFFFGIIQLTLNQVREGTFDILLLKPRATLFISLVSSFDIDDFGRLLSGNVLFWFALSHFPFPGIVEWLYFFLLFLCSLMVLLAFSLIMSALLFKWVGSSRVYDIFDSLTMFGFYPVTIFTRGFQRLVLYVFPVAMIGFIPASILLGRTIDGIEITVMVSVVSLGLGILFWHAMLKNYTSAGG